MKKKIVGIMLTVAMLSSFAAGCGSDNNSGKNAGSKAEVSNGGKVLNISCWNEEFKDRLAAHYPGYEKVDANTGKIGDVTVKWQTTPSADNAYQNALDESLLKQADAKADDKIDMFLVEADYALKYVNTDYTLDVKGDLGLTDDDLSQQYQYTKDVVTDSNKKLKGVSWQACPGSMIYRQDVAEEVFGTADPEKIQEKFKDWDSFLASAKELNKKGYRVTSGACDTYRVFSNNVESKWVSDDNKIKIDDNLMKWVEMSKEMVDNKYTSTFDIWSDDWSKGFTSAENVFCYFGPAWFVDFTLGNHDLDGKWTATVGPQGFYWGGTWICGAAGTDNADLVADIMKTLTCDKDTMVDLVKDNKDFANNKEAMDEMAKDQSYGDEILGGQNPLPIYCEGVETIDLSNLTQYDSGCNEEFQKAMKDYFQGNVDLDKALEVFYKNVETKYPELSH